MSAGKQESSPFLKKRTKKLLNDDVRDGTSPRQHLQKSFASFLQKRRPCLAAYLRRPAASPMAQLARWAALPASVALAIFWTGPIDARAVSAIDFPMAGQAAGSVQLDPLLTLTVPPDLKRKNLLFCTYVTSLAWSPDGELIAGMHLFSSRAVSQTNSGDLR